MTDSYQKIIDDMGNDIDVLRKASCWHEANTLDSYKNRLEALRENPYLWMDRLGDIVECDELKHLGYTIPLIRGD